MDNTKDSIDFSLGDDNDLKHLLEDINSSFSIEVSCSFDYSREIDEAEVENLFVENKPKKRKGLPEDVKKLTYEFVNILFSEYLNKVNMNSTKGKYGATASTNFTSNINTKTSNFYSLETHDNFKAKNKNFIEENDLRLDKQFFNKDKAMVPAAVGAAIDLDSNKYDEKNNYFKRKAKFNQKYSITEMGTKKIYSRNKAVEFKGLNTLTIFENSDVGHPLLTCRDINTIVSPVVLPPIESTRPQSSKSRRTIKSYL